MWFKMIPRDLSWLTEAPSSLHIEVELDATPELIFAMWEDLEVWPRWFSDVVGGEWIGAARAGVGSRRTVILKTMQVREEFIAYEPGRRFAFHLYESTLPLALSMIEDLKLQPLPGGRSRFNWDVYYQLRWYMRPFEPILRRIFGGMFERASQAFVGYVRTQQQR